MLALLLTKPAAYAAGVLVAAGTLWAIYSAVLDSGAAKQLIADQGASLADVKVQQNVEDATRRAGPAGVAAGLQPWTRDK